MTPTLMAVIETARTVESVPEQRVRHLESKFHSLMGAERGMEPELREELLRAKIATEMAGKRRIDSSVLNWRWAKPLKASTFYRIPLPKIVLLSLKSPLFSVKASWSSRLADFNDDLPLWIQSHYDDIGKALVEYARGKELRATLSFMWKGIIPAEAKATILEAKEDFDDIFLLTETPASDWALKSAPEPRSIDPLIAGHKHKALFLLGSFDPTPLEEYISQEFTS